MSCTFSLVKHLTLIDEWFRQLIRAWCSLTEVSMSLVALIDAEGGAYLQKTWTLEDSGVTAAWEVDYRKLLQSIVLIYGGIRYSLDDRPHLNLLCYLKKNLTCSSQSFKHIFKIMYICVSVCEYVLIIAGNHGLQRIPRSWSDSHWWDSWNVH